MSNEYETRTEFTFTWKIENYSSCLQNTILKSPEFTAESLGGSKWKLFLSPGGSEGYVSSFLYRSENDTGLDKVFINYEIEIIDPEGEILKSHKNENVGFERGDGWGWSNFIESGQLDDKMENWEEDILIIRCCMKSVPRKIPASGCEVRTKVNMGRLAFKWDVMIRKSHDCFGSRMCSLPGIAVLVISLIVPDDNLIIYIRIFKDVPRPLFLTGRISLLDVKGDERASKSDRHDIDSEDDEGFWKFPNFISISHLKTEKDKFLKKGTFSIFCEFSEFSASYGIESEEIEKYTNDAPIHCHNRLDAFSVLHDELRSLFTSKKHSDVQLRTEGKTTPAHKSILAARSPVFSAMFDQDMTESQTGVVDIPDMDIQTMESFLTFVYSGIVDDMDYERGLNLLIVADKYQVLSLKEKCATFLISVLSEENVCEVLAISDMIGHRVLKQSALDYVMMNADKILSSIKYAQWIENNARLATEIFSMLASRFGTVTNKTSGELVKKSCANERPEKLRVSELEKSRSKRN